MLRLVFLFLKQHVIAVTAATHVHHTERIRVIREIRGLQLPFAVAVSVPA
jgi:hypothetical protein